MVKYLHNIYVTKLMPRKYKELLKFNKEKNDPIQKLERHSNQEMDKRCERNLTKEITETANRYIKQ